MGGSDYVLVEWKMRAVVLGQERKKGDQDMMQRRRAGFLKNSGYLEIIPNAKAHILRIGDEEE